MPRKSEPEGFLDNRTWRYLVNFWTLVIYAVTIVDFYKSNGLVEFIGPISAIYIAILAIYTTQKEFERWSDQHVGKHPGEMYVVAWTILIILMLGLQILHHETYRLPSEVFSTYVVVLGILAVVALPRYFDLTPRANAASEAGVVGGVRAGIATVHANSNPPAYPAALDAATNGACTAANPCFGTVLSQGGITSQWTRISATQYRGPTGTTYTYTQNPDGIFQ